MYIYTHIHTHIYVYTHMYTCSQLCRNNKYDTMISEDQLASGSNHKS